MTQELGEGGAVGGHEGAPADGLSLFHKVLLVPEQPPLPASLKNVSEEAQRIMADCHTDDVDEAEHRQGPGDQPDTPPSLAVECHDPESDVEYQQGQFDRQPGSGERVQVQHAQQKQSGEQQPGIDQLTDTTD